MLQYVSGLERLLQQVICVHECTSDNDKTNNYIGALLTYIPRQVVLISSFVRKLPSIGPK